MSDLRSCLKDTFPDSCGPSEKLILKGGAILDIMCGRKPRDYDLMSIGMSNEEFLKFLAKFVKKMKPTKIELVHSQVGVTLFRVTLPNGDLLEFIMNLDLSNDALFQENFLPDQICYKPVENKLYANEYTLWSLNYGYCELELERHPKSQRLSAKLRHLGFNFFYEYEFEHKSKFLKERLERFVFRITDASEGTSKSPSYMQTQDEDITDDPDKNKDDNQSDTVLKFEKDLIRTESNKIVFANKRNFNEYVNNEIENNKKNVHPESNLVTFNFNGAIILSNKQFDSNQNMSTGLNWSY